MKDSDERRYIDELLSAYLDGELNEDERKEVEQRLRVDPQAERYLYALRETRALLQYLPAEPAPEGMVEQIMTAAGRRGAAAGEPAAGRTMHPGRWGAFVAAAVVLLAVIPLAWFFRDARSVSSERNRVAMLEGDDNVGGRPLSKTVPLEGFADAGAARRDEIAADRPARAGKAGAAMELKGAAEVADALQVAGAGEHAVDLADDGELPVAFSSAADQDTVQQQALHQTVTFAGQVQMGASAAALAAYEFANEKVELTIHFDSDRDRDAFARHADRYFAERGFINAADVAQRPQVSDASLQQVFVPGRQGINYRQQDSRQYLISAPPQAIDDLITQVHVQQGPQGAEQAVELRLGDMRVQGVQEARQALRASAEGSLVNDSLGLALAQSPDGSRPATTAPPHYRGAEQQSGAGPASNAVEQERGESPGQPAVDSRLRRSAARVHEPDDEPAAGQKLDTALRQKKVSAGRRAAGFKEERADSPKQQGDQPPMTPVRQSQAARRESQAPQNLTFILNLVSRPAMQVKPAPAAVQEKHNEDG